MGFANEPVLRMHHSGNQWELVEPLVYIRGDHSAIVIPEGFQTDLASIPQIFQNVFPVNGPYSPPAILHDYLYTVQRTTRAQADAIFLEAMESCGVAWLTRRAIHLAVRLGGWRAWR